MGEIRAFESDVDFHSQAQMCFNWDIMIQESDIHENLPLSSYLLDSNNEIHTPQKREI